MRKRLLVPPCHTSARPPLPAEIHGGRRKNRRLHELFCRLKTAWFLMAERGFRMVYSRIRSMSCPLFLCVLFACLEIQIAESSTAPPPSPPQPMAWSSCHCTVRGCKSQQGSFRQEFHAGPSSHRPLPQMPEKPCGSRSAWKFSR